MSIEIHGPMYQAECNLCHDLMDIRGTREEAVDDAMMHDCVDTLVRGANFRSGWVTDVERPDGDTIVATYRRRVDG